MRGARYTQQRRTAPERGGGEEAEEQLGEGHVLWIIDQDEVLTFDPSGVNIVMIPQPSGDTASVPTNWRTRNREYYKRRQPGCTLP
jgi:hypothetical protein